MYELVVTSQFSAAHNLREYQGKCEALHGHNWRVDVFVRANSLGADGMVIDFRVLKEETEKVLETLDHQYLNDLPFFKNAEPSSENIARYIYEALEERLRSYRHRPYRVTAWESERAGVSYVREE